MKILTAMVGASAALLSGCASIPSNMVSYFNSASCPKGWANVSDTWRGRYVVVAAAENGGIVGEPLTPGENRVTGDHGHTIGPAITPPRGNADNASARWGDDGYQQRTLSAGGAMPRNEGETVRPGTNAPYVALRACSKL